MLCNFQDFQAESSPALSEAEYEKGLPWHVRGCLCCAIMVMMQHFCRVREEQLRLYLIFTSIKMHMYGKQSTPSPKESISTCCHHSVVKIFPNF